MALDLITGGLMTRTFRGDRFVATHQTPGTAITAQTSYAATTPTLIIYGATREIVVSRIVLSQDGTIANANPNVSVVVDSAARYASGGTAFGIVARDSNHAKTTTATAKTGATASAAGSGTKVIGNYRPLKFVTGLLAIDYPDGIVIPVAGTFLLYTWSATTAPTWLLNVDFLEV